MFSDLGIYKLNHLCICQYSQSHYCFHEPSPIYPLPHNGPDEINTPQLILICLIISARDDRDRDKQPPAQKSRCDNLVECAEGWEKVVWKLSRYGISGAAIHLLRSVCITGGSELQFYSFQRNCKTMPLSSSSSSPPASSSTSPPCSPKVGRLTPRQEQWTRR